LRSKTKQVSLCLLGQKTTYFLLGFPVGVPSVFLAAAAMSEDDTAPLANMGIGDSRYMAGPSSFLHPNPLL
jgi:hypothetical protein